MNKDEEVERGKTITLKDNKNKQETYMLNDNLLGKGKYGQVYKATNLNDKNKVFAVKVIKIENEKVKQQYLKQLQIIKHLPSSLNLVKIHPHHLQSKNNFYIFQQFCDGGNLSQLRKKRKNQPFTQQQAYNIFYQLVNGLLDLQKSNIFHEDIKPQNILIKNNLYKFTDFGISQIKTNNTNPSQLRKGTLIYMPLQKLTGKTFRPTQKTQIYSLGVTLFQVIFGYHPYLKQNPNNYQQYIKLIKESPFPSLEQLKDRFKMHSLCLDKFIRVVLKMIEKSDAKRMSMQQLKEYVKKTEPFKSMVITKEQSKPKRNRPVKYELTGHSNVLFKTQGDLTDLCVSKPMSNSQRMQKIMDVYKKILQLFRDCTEYFQQGLLYSKRSGVSQLKKKELQSVLGLNNEEKVTEIQFLILFFIEKLFTELQKITNNLIFQSDNEVDSNIGYQIFEDKQFIQSEFLKIYLDLKIDNKKQIWSQLKVQGIKIAQIISNIAQKIYSGISDVKINYKNDMLSILYIKQVPIVINFLKVILESIISNDFNQIEQYINSSQYNSVMTIINDFNKIQGENRKKIYERFEEKTKGDQIVGDLQSNSGDFEILDINEIEQ